jgi:hypothetical protein
LIKSNIGEYDNKYTTTAQDQNKNIDIKKPIPIAKLNETLRNDLVNSHFKFGNEQGQYISEFKNEFTNKPINEVTNTSKLGILLRNHNYSLGLDNNVSYLTETHDKYTSPIITKDFKINTNFNIQNVNYKLGSENDDWLTTSQISYIPKVYMIK